MCAGRLILFVYKSEIFFLYITNLTSERKLGFVCVGGWWWWWIISGSDSTHIKALVIPRVVVYCIGKDQLRFHGSLRFRGLQSKKNEVRPPPRRPRRHAWRFFKEHWFHYRHFSSKITLRLYTGAYCDNGLPTNLRAAPVVRSHNAHFLMAEPLIHLSCTGQLLDLVDRD